MTADITTARDDIHELLIDAWEADQDSRYVRLMYWDLPKDTPRDEGDEENPEAWARISVLHTNGFQASLAGDSGRRRWRRTGTVFVDIFTPTGDGLSLADKLTMVAMRAFEGNSTSSGIWFRNVRPEEIGPDGVWFQTQVRADFEYDEVR